MTLHDKSREEAALVVLVPEADELVGPFRQRYDPSALEGMGAHITVNYPFQPKQTDRELLIEELEGQFAGFSPKSFNLTELRKFPDTLYLAVEPDHLFRELIEVIARRYPESPPYGGVIDEVIPHVSIAEIYEESQFAEISKEFAVASSDRLPIEGYAEEVWLMDYKDGFWAKTVSFRLSS